MFEVTIDDVRKAYYGQNAFPDDDIETIEHLTEYVLALVQDMLADEDRTLEEDILSGKLNAVIIKNLVADVVKRTYDDASRDMGELEGFNQVTQSAPGYSVNVSIMPKGSVYFRAAEKSKLKLGGNTISVLLPYSFD